MWIVVGHRVKTERVAGGARVQRECESCGEEATFYERRVVSTLRLYFVDVLDYGDRRVMACGACGALYQTDEHGESSAQTSGWERTLAEVGDRAKAAVDRAGSFLAPMIESAGEVAADAVDSASSALGPAAKRAGDGLGDALGKLGSSGGRRAETKKARPRPREEHEREEDPEKAALLRRFAELEKKLKADKGD